MSTTLLTVSPATDRRNQKQLHSRCSHLHLCPWDGWAESRFRPICRWSRMRVVLNRRNSMIRPDSHSASVCHCARLVGRASDVLRTDTLCANTLADNFAEVQSDFAEAQSDFAEMQFAAPLGQESTIKWRAPAPIRYFVEHLLPLHSAKTFKQLYKPFRRRHGYRSVPSATFPSAPRSARSGARTTFQVTLVTDLNALMSGSCAALPCALLGRSAPHSNRAANSRSGTAAV